MGIKERKKLEKQRMQERILATAMKLFLNEGFERVTIRRIAEVIEYSPATIYLYFKNKNEILYALHVAGLEKFYKRQQTVLSIKDPQKRLYQHAKVYVEFALENPEYYDLMFIMKEPVKKMKGTKKWELAMRSYDLLKETIKESMEAGYLATADLDAATFGFWSLTHGIASLVIRERSAMFPEKRLNSIIAGALDFMTERIIQKKS